MKKKFCILPIAVILLLALIYCMGVGPYMSSSASHDLTDALIELHGAPYTNQPVENGTEDMAFFIESKSFFPTNYSLRRTLGWDYQYTCKVVYTTHTATGDIHTRTITYTGIDPMGKDQDTSRAYIDVSTAE